MPIIDHYDATPSTPVHRIMADAEPARVYRDSAAVATSVVSEHLLQLNQALLDAIAAGDYGT